MKAPPIGDIALPAPILFPTKPHPDESLAGYLARTTDLNGFDSTSQLLRLAGIAGHKNVSNKIAQELSSVSSFFGISAEQLRQILIPIPPHNHLHIDYCGINLPRSRFEFDIRRVSPASLRKSSYHRAQWQIKSLPLCMESWEFLIDHCPGATCGKTLGWLKCVEIDRCEHCQFDLKQAEPPQVTQELIGSLSLARDLFHHSPSVRSGAISRLAPPFQQLAHTDACELFHLVAEALSPNITKNCQHPETSTSTLALAAEFLMDFPNKLSEISLDEGNRRTFKTSSLFWRLRERARGGETAQKSALLAMADSAEAAYYGYCRSSRMRNLAHQATPRLAAAQLGISTRNLEEIIRAGLCGRDGKRPPINGLDQRWIEDEDITWLRNRLQRRMTLVEFSQRYGVPLAGIEQLISLGLLQPCAEPVVQLVHRDADLDRESVATLIDRVANDVAPPLPDSIALEDVFHGIGAREKPWGPLIAAALAGQIPGGLGLEPGAPLRFERVTIPKDFAWDLLSGRYPQFTALPENAQGLAHSRGCSRLEAQRYLNCFSRDLSWLVAHGHLFSFNNGTSIYRGEVEALGVDLISSREISWRWRVSPEMREALPATHGIKRALGSFWPRKAVEEHFHKHFGQTPHHSALQERSADTPRGADC